MRNKIKKAYLSLFKPDTENVQKAQVNYLGKVRDVEQVSIYGLNSAPDVGSQVILMQMNGQEENLVGFANDVNGRLKGLLPGEVALYNSKTKATVKLDASGNISITAPAAVNVTATTSINLTAAGNITATATGTADVISTGNASVTAPNIVLTGNVFINGALSGGTPGSPGPLLGGSTVAQFLDTVVNGKNTDGHLHAAGTPPGNTGAF